MIQLSQVTKVFNQGQANEFTGISQVDLMIAPQKITCFQGASGCGKTTLLAMVGCISRPTSGRITLNGQILSGLPERFLARMRQEHFGFVFQHFNLIRGLSVLENVMLPGYPSGTGFGTLSGRAHDLLARFGLAKKARMKIETLSGGEAQRTAICRALVNEPEIIIADEPTANLDSGLSQELVRIFDDLKQEGKTVIIASHDAVICDSDIIDHHVFLKDGSICQEDPDAA